MEKKQHCRAPRDEYGGYVARRLRNAGMPSSYLFFSEKSTAQHTLLTRSSIIPAPNTRTTNTTQHQTNHGGREEVSLRQTWLEFGSLGVRAIGDEMRKGAGQWLRDGLLRQQREPRTKRTPMDPKSCVRDSSGGRRLSRLGALELRSLQPGGRRFLSLPGASCPHRSACLFVCVRLCFQGRGCADTR